MKNVCVAIITFILFFLGFISLLQSGEHQSAILSLVFGIASLVAGIVPMTDRLMFGDFA